MSHALAWRWQLVERYKMFEKNKKRLIERAIVKTLIYSDIFDYPLTAGEIYRRMIGNPDLKSRAGTEETLRHLMDQGRVEKKGKYYFLPGREKIVKLRKKREKYSREKMKIARQTAKLIKIISTVKFVGVTGSVAAGNAKKEDDIDFFIISSAGWLWTTRLLVTLLVGLTGRRRRPGESKVKNKICLNMFVDESSLDADSQVRLGFAHNLFIANEIAQLRPIINKDKTYQKFLSANQWVKNFLPNAFKEKTLQVENFNYLVRSHQIVDRLWDKLLMKIQLWWMRRRKTTEVTNPHLIAFHPKDISQEVVVKYKGRTVEL